MLPNCEPLCRQAPLQRGNPCFEPIKTYVDRIESTIHAILELFEAAIDRVEPPVYGLEALRYRLEALIHPSEASTDRVSKIEKRVQNLTV